MILDLPRYLLGVLEIFLLVGFASLAGAGLRSRLLPDFRGALAHLATAVLALAVLVWAGELLGSFGLFQPGPYVIAVVTVGSISWTARGFRGEKPSKQEGHPRPVTLIALAIAAAAVVRFGLEVKPNLTTGMTGFDSTWYHGPFAAGFFQSGSTWDLHFIAPQFLAWFYPANAEIFHGVGMLAFGRDLLSPLLNLGWFLGCLVACWCIGRPYRVAPWSLGLGAIALSLPVLADQAGEARNDIVGIFFLLAAVAIGLNAFRTGKDGAEERGGGADRGVAESDMSLGAAAVVGLSAGLAAGAKLNFLLPAAVLVLGLPFVVSAGRRWRTFALGAIAALAGGGYWYLRNLAHSGNPLPWFDSLGPISLPAPDQPLGGREGHSVLGYLTDGAVWSDWLLPGLRDGLTILWPLLAVAALGGLLLCLGRRASPVLRLIGLVGLAAILAWLVAPTSASGPEGMPRGFESGLRYLAPALVLGLALLPATPPLRSRLRGIGSSLSFPAHFAGNDKVARLGAFAALGVLAIGAVGVGYPVQRHYLENRYADPTFAAPGLNAAFKLATPLSDARIATTSTRQYPLYGTDLSNHVQFIGERQPHGGFTAPTTCRQWRRLLNDGAYDYVVTTHDRVAAGKPPYPDTSRWTEGSGATPILRLPPTVVYKLNGSLNPSGCP